jgi:hypothetical protein
MKRIVLIGVALAATMAVALPAVAAPSGSPGLATVGGSKPGTAQVGIQSTTIGTDVSPINGFWNQGWWSDNEVNFNINTNHIVGVASPLIFIANGHARNYFTFDITALSAHPCATPQSATLTVDAAVGSWAIYQTGPLFVNYRLYDVDTDPFVLSQKDNNPDAAIFGDLGSGPLFGSYFLPTFTVGGRFALNLNLTGLNAIAAAKANGEQFFSIGGSLVPQPLVGNVFLMGFSGSVVATLTVNWPFICRIRPPA